jgi:hypothetical protein
MSFEARPAAIPFEPGSGALPPALEPAIIDSDSPILLLVAAEAGEAAGRAAIELAEASAARGRETVLADASTRAPALHELLEVQNLEGLADVFLFGASLERVRTRPPGWSFDFIPMGAYVPDPAAVLESARWSRISAGLAADDARLFLFLPASSPGIGLLSKRAGQAVLLGDPAGVARAAERLDRTCEVVAVVEPSLAEAIPSLMDEPLARDEPELSEPPVFRAEEPEPRRVSPLLLILLVAALVAAGWFLYREYYASPATSREPTPVASAEPAPPAPADPGEPVETPIPYSVAVEAHQDLDAARERLSELQRSEPGILFYLSPVVVRQLLYYRVLAGPVEDQAAGERLMSTLVDRGHKTEWDQWSVLATEHAFLLGEYGSADSAHARVDSLGALDVPAYVVPLRYDRGPEHYRVYGGAYVTEAEAMAMREMLTEAGLEARLVTRTGEPLSEGS